MRILMVGSQMALAGAQRMLLSQAVWFHERGHLVTVAFFYDKQNLKEHWRRQYPFRIHDLEGWDLSAGTIKRYLRLICALFRLYRILLRGRYDVVEAYTPHSNMLALVAAGLARVPVRIATHHGVIEGMPSWLHRLHGVIVNSPLTNCMVAVSNQVKEVAMRQDGIDEEKIDVIENGIEIRPKPDGAAQIRARLFRDLDLPPETKFLLTVGRLAYEKGHTFLLDAAPKILEKHPESVFAFAGVGTLETSLREKCNRMGLERKVLFLGNRNDIFDFYAACDALLMPSLREGLPIAMLEAMSQEVPVVVSGVSDEGPLLSGSQARFVLPPRDPLALSQAVNELLADLDTGRQIGRDSAEIVRRYYSDQIMCQHYYELFRRNLSR